MGELGSLDRVSSGSLAYNGCGRWAPRDTGDRACPRAESPQHAALSLSPEKVDWEAHC